MTAEQRWEWTQGDEAVLAVLEQDAAQIPLGRPNFGLVCGWLRGAIAELERLQRELEVSRAAFAVVERYAQHLPECASENGPGIACSCGLPQ